MRSCSKTQKIPKINFGISHQVLTETMLTVSQGILKTDYEKLCLPPCFEKLLIRHLSVLEEYATTFV